MMMMMTQKSLRHHHRKASQKCCLCCASSELLLATKAIARLLWFKVPLRFSVGSLLFFPSIYFFSSSHHRWLFLYILFLIAFSTVVFLVAPKVSHYKPIRVFLARHFPRFYAPELPKRVVWSIGSKAKVEEGADSSSNSGYMVKVYSNGDVYEGEFYRGKSSGSGVYYYKMKGRYEGDWVDQKYDGCGVETWSKGSRYRGQYRQGLRHGFGVFRYYNGDVYAGEWYMGQCHGFGVHTCEDGSKYVGEFKGGLKHGIGHYRFRNGDTYAGEYFGDKTQGFGVYRFANGHIYEGAWHEGRRQGFGLYTFRNGDTQSGHWENGVLSASSFQEPASGPSMTDSHKVLHAVQEARRIADKATAMPDVDERVNRAVAAANRAANAARVAAVKAVQNRMHQNPDKDDFSTQIV